MKVTVVSLVFTPDRASTAYIVEALAEGTVAAGHEVQVLTTTPHYGNNAENVPSIEKRGGSFTIRRQKMEEKSSSVLGRFFAWARFAAGTFWRTMRLPRPDVCLVISPPLFVGVSAAFLKACRKTPYVYVVQEALSDVLKHLGLIPAPAVTAIRLMESFIYKRASAVVAISPAMKTLLVDAGVEPSKVHIIENFAFGATGATSRPHSTKPGTLLLSYLGNLGPAQDLDTVIRAAKVPESAGWRFLIGGGGTRAQEIREKTIGFANFAVVDSMPLDKALSLTAASSACLVLQSKGTGSSALPSKIYQIMSLGRPVIAVCDSDSGVAHILTTSGAGVSVEPGDSAALAQLLDRLRNSPIELARMGEAGKRYVAEHANQTLVTAQYVSLLEQIASQRCGRGIDR